MLDLGPWFQLYVKDFSNGTPILPEYAQRIDQHLNQQAASAFVAPHGLPTRNADGEFEIRVFSEGNLGFVKFILTDHYGVHIIRETRNESENAVTLHFPAPRVSAE